MRTLLSLLLLMVLPLFVICQTATSIPIQMLPSGHILVKAKIDGVEGSFIFDTGAGLTLVTKTFFDKLSHTKKEDGGYTGFRATGERLDIDLYQVNNVEFGSLKKAVEEISFLDVNLGGIDGILSLKLVEAQPFTIDYDKQVLILETAGSLSAIQKKAKKMPVQLEDSRGKSLTLFSYFTINDTLTLQLSLDAGAGKDVYRLNSKYLKALGVDTNDTVAVKKIQKPSEINKEFLSTIYMAPIKKIASLTQPGIKTENLRAQFVEELIYDGIIWINWIGKRITFDLAGNALWVER